MLFFKLSKSVTGASINLFIRMFLSISDRPFVDFVFPGSRKFNAVVGDSVSLSVNYQAIPAVSFATNWSFVNTAGYIQELPAGSSTSD